MTAERTTTVPHKKRSLNTRRSKRGKKRASRDNVVYLGNRPASALRQQVVKKRVRPPVFAPQVFCDGCQLSHSEGDDHNRIGADVVAGELGIKVSTVKKYVQRARYGEMQFPVPVTPRNSKMLFDACGIALHRHQMTAPVERAVQLEVERVRLEHDAAILRARVENANLDIQLERLALDMKLKAKRDHRKRLIDLYRQMFQDEAAFRARMRVLEKELKQYLSDGERGW